MRSIYRQIASVGLFFLINTIALAQTQSSDSAELIKGQTEIHDEPVSPIANPSDTSVLKTVDVQSNFVGGDKAFIQFVADNFQYPVRCQEEGISGYVMLRFIVDTKGRISNISAIEETKSCPEFAEEAIRVLKLSPAWIPAQVNGKFVKSYRLIPISLRLE